MADYTGQQATTLRLITKFGGDFTLRGFDDTAADPSKPWDGPTDPRAGGVSEVTLKAVQVDPGEAAKLGHGLRIEDLAKRSDKFLIIASTSDLTVYNEVQAPDGPYRITGMDRLAPDGSSNIIWFVGIEQ